MGVETHGLAHDVGGFGPAAGQEAHLVHSVEELSVGGFEAVYLRDCSGDDNAHGVGHIVGLESFGNRLLRYFSAQTDDVRVGLALCRFLFLSGHVDAPFP